MPAIDEDHSGRTDAVPRRWSAPLSAAERRRFEPFVHELIAAAFGVIDSYFLRGAAVELKGDATPVTAADRGAEGAMRQLIEARFPSHGIVGEEFGQRAASAIDGARYRWVLDPVDGTKAFIANCFLFGTLIALERADGPNAAYRPVLGAIAHGAARVALIGAADGTTLFFGDGSQRPAHARAPRPLSEVTVLTTDHVAAVAHLGDDFEALIRRCRLYRTWGDCFGYFAVATGGADLMIDPVLAYWDIAAIIPVLEGAGATVASLAGGDPLTDLTLVVGAQHLVDDVIAGFRPMTHP